MKKLFILASVFMLAGCTPSEKMLEESAPKKNSLIKEEMPATKTSPQQAASQSAVNNKTMYQNPPALTLDTKKKYTATLTTSQGVIEIELFASSVPNTVNNFVFLVKEKFYDGVIFHRTIPGFMIQGGDPTGTGMGGPGYSFADEAITGEYTRGTVAMANSGPNTNGSQFFIMHKDTALPKSYVIFGKVINGLAVVDAIATAPTIAGGENSQPQSPVTIESATINEQ